jgi:four helix bundle protein
MSKYKELEDRTLKFSKDVIRFCNKLPKNTVNFELIKQVVRSACSIGANYREANEALGKKDFIHRLRISRKEAKETSYWLEILAESNQNFKEEIEKLLNENQQLRNILSAIISKAS